MAWRIEITDRATRDLARLGSVEGKRIIGFLRERLASVDDPRTIGKSLRGSRFEGVWRYRVGDHRILVEIQDKKVTVLVIAIAHRSDVYR